MSWLLVLLFVATSALAQETGGKSPQSTGQPKAREQSGGNSVEPRDPKRPPSDRLARLAPEPVTILTENGNGSVAIIFVRKPGVELPLSSRKTDAIGSSNSIPNSDITFRWQDNPSHKASQREILIANIIIDTRVFVEPEINYKGSVLLVWPDYEQRLDFTIVGRVTLALELYPEKTDVVMGPLQAENVKVRIKNTGKAAINGLTISTLGFVDSATHHQAHLADGPYQADIPQSEEREVSVRLPKIDFAGTYIGNLDFVANGKVRKSIPLTIRQRGPLSIFGYLYWSCWPPILFLTVLLVGLFSSFGLDSWFGLGGLQRAQATISLNETKTALQNTLQDTNKWEASHNEIRLSKTKTRLDESLNELNLLWANVNSTSQAKLASEGQRFAALAEKFNVFWAMLQSAATTWGGNQSKLKEVAEKLDRVPLGTPDVNNYRNNLLRALEDTADAAEHGSMVSQAEAAKAADTLLNRLRRKIQFMAYAQQSFVWLVVLLFAYQTFYANNLAFGRLFDYVSLFLWTLGLTQTGSQIVARVRTSSARSQHPVG